MITYCADCGEEIGYGCECDVPAPHTVDPSYPTPPPEAQWDAKQRVYVCRDRLGNWSGYWAAGHYFHGLAQ